MVNISEWDASEYLDDEETILEYLNAAAQAGDPGCSKPHLGTSPKHVAWHRSPKTPESAVKACTRASAQVATHRSARS